MQGVLNNYKKDDGKEMCVWVCVCAHTCTNSKRDVNIVNMHRMQI